MINHIGININDFKRLTKPVNPNKMSIYYYNDTHGNTDQMAGVLVGAKAFKEKMQDCDSISFVLSAGDNCSGADINKNAFFFDLMQNYMGVDISAVGNHECDAGADAFNRAMENKKLQFVATNVNFAPDNPMNEFVKKSIIKEQNGVKTGFIGTMPMELKTVLKNNADDGIDVMDEKATIDALQKEIDNLKNQGVNKIILLSHMGYDADKQAAKNLDGVDIIIGGHTHNLIEGVQEGENYVLSKTGEPVLITQAGENAKYYGIVDVEFNDDGVLTKVNNTVIENPNTKKSPIIEGIKLKEIGESPVVGTIAKIEPLPDNRRIEPCAWTEFMMDAVRNELDVDIALVNSANIRKVPQEGSVTKRDIQESAPMKNHLQKTRITQKQLVEGIQNTAINTMTSPDGFPGLIQASGITYKIEDTGKLTEMNFINKDGSITPIDINNPSQDITYSAAYDDFFSKKEGGETPEFAPIFEVETFDFDKDTATSEYISKLPNKDNLEITDDKRLEIINTGKQIQKDNNSRKFLSLTSKASA